MAANEEVARGVNLTAHIGLRFQLHVSNAETEATARSIADNDCIVSQLARGIHCISLTEQMWFKQELSISLIKFKAWWQGISVQKFQRTYEHCVIHFGYPHMHLVSHKSVAIWRVGYVNTFSTDFSEWLHIGKVKDQYWSTNKVNYIGRIV